jgi:hypothetical protein
VKREPRIPVVFRCMEDGEPIALFPTLPENWGCCVAYVQAGQHTIAAYKQCLRDSRPAKPSEYADLKAELEQLGYRLEVRKRAPSWRQALEENSERIR